MASNHQENVSGIPLFFVCGTYRESAKLYYLSFIAEKTKINFLLAIYIFLSKVSKQFTRIRCYSC
jgi:hypothetical protein